MKEKTLAKQHGVRKLEKQNILFLVRVTFFPTKLFYVLLPYKRTQTNNFFFNALSLSKKGINLHFRV